MQRSLIKRATYSFTRIASRMIGVALFSARFEGRDRVPKELGALVCSNHQSFFDPVLVGMTIDRRLNFLARESLFRSKVLGFLLNWYDSIPIARDGLGIGGIKETLRRLKRGELVLIFPEGTRTPDGEVQEIKPGFCALARRSKVPLVPVGIDGAYHAWPRNKKLPGFAKISIQVGNPIPPEEFELLSDDELMTRLQNAIHEVHQRARQLRNA